ncbi:hypothetical protein FSP39_012588, partial [Pinctada imbricata]
SRMVQKGQHILLLLFVLGCANCYPYFQREIPNGQYVPHPCKNITWKGIGHVNPLGGGARNKFGLDFSAAGEKWTRELCMLDSDLDGKTNGEELGDPLCTWRKGDPRPSTTGITHPGICEPFDSPRCFNFNKWVDCNYGDFACKGLEEPDLVKHTLRFPRTKVPDKPTNYRCISFDLPTDADYHMIAFEPIIDNSDVLHHIALYGCEDNAVDVTEPTGCFMTRKECRTVIAGWAVGLPGECLPREAGISIGTKGFKKAYMQMHWTNHKVGEVNYTDSSGLTLYLTKNKRKYDAGILNVGQEYLKLPPGQSRVMQEGICTKEMLSKRMLGPIYVSTVANHMHLIGKSMTVELHRDGKLFKTLSHDGHYGYESPVIHRHKPPIAINSGDSIKSTCYFDTTNKTKTVFNGFGTLDEMCYAFLVVYPKKNLLVDTCVPWKTIDWTLVKYHHFIPFLKPVIDGCNFAEFKDLTNPKTIALHKLLSDNCHLLSDCLEECVAAVNEAMKHPCMKGHIGDYLKEEARKGDLGGQFKDFYSRIDSCNREMAKKTCRRIVFVPIMQRCGPVP